MQAGERSESMDTIREPQYAALPGHMRQRAVKPALQNNASRATAEVTAENIEALSAFSQNSFEVPSNYMTLTDPESSLELQEGEDGRKAEKESRMAFLNSLNIREQALRRAQRIGLDEAIAEVEMERKDYLASR